jgi:hypothetical protein
VKSITIKVKSPLPGEAYARSTDWELIKKGINVFFKYLYLTKPFSGESNFWPETKR